VCDRMSTILSLAGYIFDSIDYERLTHTQLGIDVNQHWLCYIRIQYRGLYK